jgi:FtsP/CotA-like multicopper oxidase with cupredoxin domain
MHLSGGDGFVTMADGRPQYIFSFADLTGVAEADAMDAGMLAAAFPAPQIAVDEGKEFYLSLTNVGMVIRPDLFDPHTVHFHGFPQSSTVFDGLPESGISINMGATLTYYYNLVEPGTYMYHCHVEATEHMQMGMLGNLYVRAAQAGPIEYPAGSGRTYSQFAYNDIDGSTGYDVEFALQLGSFDPDFHDASWTVQPLPFAHMWDRYPMINGRGYPDTVNPSALPAPVENGGIQSQLESSLITANQGERILLRLSNLNITDVHTLQSPSIPMEVVGIDAKQLRSTSGENLYYTTNSVTLGGGMSADVILDTVDVDPGEYYVYAANLQYLANFDEDQPTGGMMTKIVVN